eukprot:CAMPEP_0113538904 /NCGR_PEP_ID=MMETSP0015_2-20120614/7625_1 /TAXON_ID=2838 /ORGANISM="Odontella" /LENGTH=300 /DNA_ID=CAMNT_0000438531 /DNA_START=406 /DNA_END=1304 /DNA_ORIENTATION=- /assembly_acc=CAM_ASM_000160
MRTTLPMPISAAAFVVVAVVVVLCGLSGSSEAFLQPTGRRAAAAERGISSPLHAKRGKAGKKGGGGGGGGGGGATMTKGPPGRIVPAVEYVECQPDGADAWRCLDVSQLLLRGGCGVVPTETGYGLVSLLDSREGLERILRIKGQERCKKPLSLLCSDLSTIDAYCYGINRGVFKTLKKNLPGPYTFILPASTALPKSIFVDAKGSRHAWARKTLGVRMSSDPVLRYVQDELLDGAPLLVSSLPREEENEDDDEDDIYASSVLSCGISDAMDGASWCQEVDFIVDAGERPFDGSTIFDLT